MSQTQLLRFRINITKANGRFFVFYALKKPDLFAIMNYQGKHLNFHSLLSSFIQEEPK